MIQITVKEISHENFSPFGSFYPMETPQGYALSGEIHQFFPDRLTASSERCVGYSSITIRKPDRMIINAVEYHSTTWEMIFPLTGDMILHVAPASAGKPVPHLTEAFLIPKHTLVKINAAIWHLAPLPANADSLTAMIILPECTYLNDCTVVPLSPDEQMEIIT